jgi:thioredoxin-like negative regulator of GroEL
MNVLEFEEEGAIYGIEATPTLIRFEDGEETGRIAGGQKREALHAFFDQYVLDK